MSGTYPERYERALAVTRKFLRTGWDPIGVGDIPECYGEYDSYAPSFAKMILRGASRGEIESQMRRVLACMGMETDWALARVPEMAPRLIARVEAAADG